MEPVDPDAAAEEEMDVALRKLPTDLRRHTTRGVVINSAFQVGLAGANLVRSLVLASLLTTADFGLFALIVTTIITLAYLKYVGVSDKYVQQDEDDQEAAFQKAFTVEMCWSFVLLALVAIAVPIYGLVIYDQPEIILPSLVLALVLPASALQAPIWVSYREMRFFRQRSLESIDPLVSVVMTIALAFAGFGYWSFVIGAVAGATLGAAAAILTSPYPLRFRFERRALNEYVEFSWPLLVLSLSGLVVVQGALIVGNWTVGLAGVAAIGLAGSFAAFGDRLDQLIRRTIYPAVCAVKDRRELMYEVFVKSNRLALMWGLPFGVGLALFGPDLVTYVIGERWRPAEFLIQAFGLIVGLRQVAFNWSIFLQALGRTKPMALNGLSSVVVFAVVTAPMLIVLGVDGYALGMAVTILVDLVIRSHFLAQVFPEFRITSLLLRAVFASVPAVGAVLVMRLLEGERGAELVVAELLVYVLLTAAVTWRLERPLLSEIIGYLRRSGGKPGMATSLTPTS